MKLSALNDGGSSEEEILCKFKEFFELIKDNKSPNAIGYHEAFPDKSMICVSMRYYKRGSLEQYISRVKDNPEKIPETSQLLRWFKALFKSLTLLIKLDLVHNNIKPG